MGEYRLLLFWRFAKNQKFYATLKCLLAQDRVGLEISKLYSSYSFHPISAKLYEYRYIGYHGGIRAITHVLVLGAIVHICRVLLMPDSLSLVWSHSVHFAKFPILRFSKHYSFISFHQNSTKLHTVSQSRANIGQHVFGDLPKIAKKYGALKFLAPYDPVLRRILLLLLYFYNSFHSSAPIQTLCGHCLP